MDFRGTPIQVGDLVAASRGGEYHELQEMVIFRITPKTVQMVTLDFVRKYEQDNHVQFRTESDLMSVNWNEAARWQKSRRGFNMVAKIGNLFT